MNLIFDKQQVYVLVYTTGKKTTTKNTQINFNKISATLYTVFKILIVILFRLTQFGFVIRMI